MDAGPLERWGRIFVRDWPILTMLDQDGQRRAASFGETRGSVIEFRAVEHFGWSALILTQVRS
jgi:hypothetical protein